jgi:pimeloyl-ACP methyl ester carboxylesterase
MPAIFQPIRNPANDQPCRSSGIDRGSRHSGVLRAAEIQRGSVERVQTRGVEVPIYTVWRAGAVATVVLYSGGAGGYGKIGEDGWPGSNNFLIRSAKLFAAHPFNVILVGRETDVSDLDGAARISDNHDQDNRAIFRAIKAKSPAPIWLVGTSRGSISATAAAIRDSGHDIAGIVLSSSVTSYRIKGAVPTQDLEKIKVPVVIVHHENDACRICTPYEAKNIAGGLKNSPIKKTVLVSGGTEPSGDPCGPMHYHGYIGMEKEVVDLIAAWIKSPGA